MPQQSQNLPQQDDNTLVSLSIGGNQLAYKELIIRLETKLMAFLLKRCSNYSDAQDILQDTFITAYQNLTKFDVSKPFSAWIFGIARNQANTHFRKAKPAPNSTQLQTLSDNTTPLTNLDSDDLANIFWKEAKRLLSDDEFDTLWLRYQENLPIKDIAHTLGKSLSNIKILLFRARKSLATSSLLADQHESAPNIAI